MELFVGNLPRETTPNDLRRMFRRTLFRGLRRDCRIEIVQARDARGEDYVYGHASIQPDRIGRVLARRLNGRYYRGRPLIVREYIHRATGNERRAINWRERAWDGPERRQSERRAHWLSREIAACAEVAPSGFARLVAALGF